MRKLQKENHLPVLTEYQECLLLVDYLNLLVSQKKVLMYTHIPNETFTKNWGTKMKNKRMGVTKGFPDYVIVLPHILLFIEMKKSKGGQVSLEQEAWRKALIGVNEFAFICKGFEEAKKKIDQAL